MQTHKHTRKHMLKYSEGEYEGFLPSFSPMQRLHSMEMQSIQKPMNLNTPKLIFSKLH